MSRPSVKACSTTSGTPARARQLDQRVQVVHARVHAALGDEAEQVQAPGSRAGPQASRSASFSKNEPSVDRVVDAR